MPKKKAKNRQGDGKKTEGTISRRSVLKIGAAAGAATVLAPRIITTRKAFAFADPVTPPLVQCLSTAASPPHTPFVDDLPVRFPAIDHPLNPQPTMVANQNAGEWDQDDHQRWNQFTPAHVTTELEAKPGLHRFYSDFGESYIWGFNGVYPGPMILNRYGKPTIVRFRNSLRVITTTFSRNQMTIHLHNGGHSSNSDRRAGDFFGTGVWKDKLYPNCSSLDALDHDSEPPEKKFFWFHAHRAAFTLNNYQGMFIRYDKTVPGREYSRNGSLKLPDYYGITDFPLFLTGKKVGPTINGRTETKTSVAGSDKFINTWEWQSVPDLANANVGSAWAHSVHIHYEDFRTLKRFVNGAEFPVLVPQARKENVSIIDARQGTLIKVQFRYYNGTYPIRCHNMVHEDAFMMGRWGTCPDQPSLDASMSDTEVCQNELASILRRDCATSSPHSVLKHSDSGGQSYGQNSI